MGKLVFGMMQSLDGYVAGVAGGPGSDGYVAGLANGLELPPPGDWVTWLILAGRGAGKTRTGAETVRRWVKDYSAVNLIGATAADVRDVMVLGESGVLACCPFAERPTYQRSARRLTWPNGATSLLFSAEEPDRLGAFLGATGLSPDSIRESATQPHFLAGVLEHMLADESLLVAFADSAGLNPADVARARNAMGRQWERDIP